MSTHKHIDRICVAVIIAALAVTLLFMNGESLGIEKASCASGYAERLFDTSKVHAIDIVMDDWDDFIETCENEEYAACSVVIDGESYSNVGIRAKGNTSLSSVSRLGSDRYSFKIEFDQYDSGKNYYGLDKLSLNNIIQDNTYMKDYLSYQLMGQFGVNAPLCSYVYITVNGEDWGLYLAVEAVEDSFLSRNYGSDAGALYKPDSNNMGGGHGNGRDFDFDAEGSDGTNKDAPADSGSSDNSGASDSGGKIGEGGNRGDNSGNSDSGGKIDESSEGDSGGKIGEGGDPATGGSKTPPTGDPPEMPGSAAPGDSNSPDDSAMGTGPDGMTKPDQTPDDAAPGDSNSPDDSAMSAGPDGMTKPDQMPGGAAPGDSTSPDDSATGTGPDGDTQSAPGQGQKDSTMGSADVKLQYIDDDPASYSNIFDNAKTAITDSDKSRLIESLKSLSENQDIDSVVDVEQVIRYFVVHNFVCNGDSYTGSMIHNYYLYEKDGQLAMIPWDYNLSFGGFQAGNAASVINESIDDPITGGDLSDRPMLAWIFADETYTELYHQYFSDFISQYCGSGQLEKMITETAALITPYVEKDPTKFCTSEEFETGVETLQKFCQLRSESVSLQLSGSDEKVDTADLNLNDMGSINSTMSAGPGGSGSSGGKPQGDIDGGDSNNGTSDYLQDGSNSGSTPQGDIGNSSGGDPQGDIDNNGGNDQSNQTEPSDDQQLAAPAQPDAFQGDTPPDQPPNDAKDDGAIGNRTMPADNHAQTGTNAWLLLASSVLVLLIGLVIAIKYRR